MRTIEFVDTAEVGEAAEVAASSSVPVSLVWVAPLGGAAIISGALEIGVSGRAIAIGYYTGRISECREVVV